MKKVLVTGATGNVGSEVVSYLGELGNDVGIIAAVRNPEKLKNDFSDKEKVSFRSFDFENQNTHAKAFEGIEVLFLLRPPHISEVEEVFVPLLKNVKQAGIEKVVFLSVQGVEKSKVIPHNQIERLIKEMGFEYVFVRPSYFMQNLTTTLLPEIRKSKTITLPASNAIFNWVDVNNIGEFSAHLLVRFDEFKNQDLEITGKENKSFQEVVNEINSELSIGLKYHSMNPVSFYFRKRKEGVTNGFAIVMTMLHFLPRLQKPPVISDNYEKVVGKKPTTIKVFVQREKALFQNH